MPISLYVDRTDLLYKDTDLHYDRRLRRRAASTVENNSAGSSGATAVSSGRSGWAELARWKHSTDSRKRLMDCQYSPMFGIVNMLLCAFILGKTLYFFTRHTALIVVNTFRF